MPTGVLFVCSLFFLLGSSSTGEQVSLDRQRLSSNDVVVCEVNLSPQLYSLGVNTGYGLRKTLRSVTKVRRLVVIKVVHFDEFRFSFLVDPHTTMLFPPLQSAFTVPTESAETQPRVRRWAISARRAAMMPKLQYRALRV